MKTKNKIGILITEDPEAWGEPESIGKFFLNRFHGIGGETFNFEIFYAVKGNLPSLNSVKTYGGFIISGSHYSVNDDKEWIRELEKLVVFICNIPEEHRPKIFGICFGHQLIAKALGGVVAKRDGMFIFGGENLTLDVEILSEEYYKKVFTKKNLKIMQCHGEEVQVMPECARSVASSNSCDTEIIKYGRYALTTQGHPEFTEAMMRKIFVPRFEKNGLIKTEEDYNELDKSFFNAEADGMVRFVLEFLKSK